MKQETFPVLYILMRSDMVSMNPGKAMAQASHASNAMVHKAKKHGSAKVQNLLHKWENDTKQGFGTCLVLDVDNEANILDILKSYKGNKDVLADIVNDPTYPVRDGDITHYVSINTCGYVFLDKNDTEACEILSAFDLHA